ncbi:hypothetical protein Aph01nite_43360 [Acrocarpospora phusangensis]|uniref:Helicase ATP-binding domain-containing protein n=1 Tax=Acrocarpospora phusangensis TaxID=1070424 RepID=A0A919ULC9_9ACTN|nr:SNF2-related protein [Acrocarpospora phusangensis]GIH26026.1 hypothetical protein Aph01nite_43360 [Acrocarpospora phusangensis]
MSSYAAFLERKRNRVTPIGRIVAPDDIHPSLHDWQRQEVAWAVHRGRAALWWDTGTGKTRAELEWARLSGDRSLIVAPLAVCHQTVEEAASIGIAAAYARSDEQAHGSGVWVTNYEMVDRFDPAGLDAVALDEASILKNSDGATRNRLIRHFADVPRRLAATATPAPNEPTELTSQAEFLGVMSRAEMLATYFVHDSDGWRLKGHARQPMFRWMASWASALRRPSDIGYADDGYVLPPLTIHTHLVETEGVQTEGTLFPVHSAAALGGVRGRAQVRKATVADRVAKAVELVKAEPGEPWLLWAGRNDEAQMLAAALPGAVNVEGSWKPEAKAEALLGFARGVIQILVTKPSIAGFGMNWQHCARTAFVGLSDSWEAYYQCIRRCWRYGQTRPVDAHIVLTDVEAPIAANVARKEAEASALVAELVASMNETRRGRAA